MRDLLLNIISARVLELPSHHADMKRLVSLHTSLKTRTAVDLGVNPTFWSVTMEAVGAETTCRMARILGVIQ